MADASHGSGVVGRTAGLPEPDRPVDDLVRSTSRTLWIAVPDAAGVLDRLLRDREAHVDAAYRGVRIHLLCGSGLVDDPHAVREMRIRANAGIRIRLHDRIPQPVAIADQQCAVAGSRPGASDEVLVTAATGRVQVQSLIDLFRALWRDSTSAGFTSRPRRAPGQEEPVLHALRSGLTDEAAARKLQVSVRTYRREVAKIMRRLGAKSRFEAGFRAALLDPTPAAPPSPDGAGLLAPEAI